ncbi:MAG TPA: TonB-dependent receptor [Flavobacteriia bacterium]|nr:TonB-dependent receptor [Flavobacteriia bacterium]
MLLLPLSILAQTISGIVKDENGELLPFTNIQEKGTTNGTTTDLDGKFSLRVSILPTKLIVSSLGYATIEVPVTDTKPLDITLKEEGVGLDEVVITGNRAKARTILDSPVPIDNVSVKELVNSGKNTVDEMLTYKIPSYNSTNQTISDATAHFDPADLRGLGPSRTLVLINGKRKNQSALVYINDTPGKGEVGVDMKSIPAAAIDHIEVLRDGASSQYGSDAIAGVINIILKKNVEKKTANIYSGITTKGDGFQIGTDFNGALNYDNGAYINYTFALQHQEHTNRAGKPGEDLLFGVTADDPTWGSWLTEHPDLGMTVGQPDMNTGEVMFNGAVPFKNKKGEFYATAGATVRRGKSFALYRTPYWIPDPYNLMHDAGEDYNGFQPTFETDIVDNFDIVGANYNSNGYKFDLSATYGVNSVDYTIGNTINPDLGPMSPTRFEAGGYRFSNLIGNFDVSKSFDNINVISGLEYKLENFKAVPGEPDSYYGGGAQSFPGLQPSNRVNANRNSFAAFLDLNSDITESFLLGGAVRYENYSDFGSNVSYKVNSRYKFDDKGAIRASYSTGFRAPALHQIYLSNIQTLVSGGTVSNQGTFNNVSPVIRNDLGVPQLKAETSRNISAGITFKPIKNLSFAIDVYNVKVNDRVLFTGEIGYRDDATRDSSGNIITPDFTNPIEAILDANNITSLKFFTNAVDTETNGVDFVASYNNIRLSNGARLGFNLAGNYNETKIVGEITTPQILAANGYDIFNRKEASRIESSRPRSKVTLGADYEVKSFNISLNNTYFGEVTWRHATDPNKDQTFKGKILTDLVFNYNVSEVVKFNLTVNNLLNVYPDKIDNKGDVVTDLGGRFKYPWEVNQFGFLGTNLKLGFRFEF